LQGERLVGGESISSNNGCFQLIMQGDGNLVLYGNTMRPMWNSVTVGSADRAFMQDDGNFVVYTPNMQPVWAAHPQNRQGLTNFRLIVQDDGNLVIYANNGSEVRPIWSTGTGGRNCDGSKQLNFPITGEKDNSVANGGMRTSFTLNSDGRLTAVTNTRTKVKAAGFTGGVSIILLNADRQPIWASAVHTFGVDGCLIGRCNRNDNWNDSVPPDILPQVRGYTILQQHNPKWPSLVGQKGEQFLRWLNSDEGKATISIIRDIAVML
jgi:outer membrane protein assembly factor BamB